MTVVPIIVGSLEKVLGKETGRIGDQQGLDYDSIEVGFNLGESFRELKCVITQTSLLLV